MTTDWTQPIFSNLPEVGYRDNPTAEALVSWIDDRLASKAIQVQNLYQDLCDPLTCKEEYLTYLAYLTGLSGSFWDDTWPASVKRQLILNSHTKLWPLRGTQGLLSFILNIHSIKHDIWTDGQLNLTFPLGAKFGTAKLRFYLRLPLEYRRQSKQFVEAKRTLQNYAPAVVKSSVVYNQFYLGFSVLSDPLF